MSTANPWTRRRFLETAIGAVPALAAVACGSTLGAGAGDAGIETGSDASQGSDAGLDAPAEGAAADAQPDFHCSESFPRLDLKADCGAAGDGKTNDTAAFQKAASLIQKAGGGELVIPAGVYIVGKQTVKSSANAPGAWYQAAEIFTVTGVACLKISGYGATLRVQAGLHYGGFNPSTGQPQDYTGGSQNEAAVGRIFDIQSSQNVFIEGLEIDGSNESLILGGQAGDVDRQVAATGIVFNGCSDVTVVDVHTHHHALDGIAVEHLSGPPPKKMPHQLIRVVSEYNGRQGLSWIGGWGLACTDCKFNHTGRALNGGTALFSKPGAGLDIEPNAGTTDLTRDGLFTQCEFIDNAGPGMETAGGDAGYAKFVSCTFWGTTTYSLWPVHPGIELVDCVIHGTAVHASDGSTSANPTPVPALATRFTNCTFEDVPWTNGLVYRNGSLYNLPDSTPGVTWTGCTFINHGVTAVNVADASTREVFDTCTFVFSNATLANGAKQATIQGSEITSCHFAESAAVSASGRVFFIDVVNVLVSPGQTPTHVDGPQVLWNSATTGTTGDIAPGTYA